MKTLLSLIMMTGMTANAKTLVCYTSHPMKSSGDKVERFYLHNVGSEELSAEGLSDQGTLSAFYGANGKSVAAFSNECDNMYEVSFQESEFKALLTGKIGKISGFLTYENSGDESDAAAIRCYNSEKIEE